MLCNLVRSIYGRKPSTPQKLLQKVSQLIPVGASALYNILKVYQSWTPGKLFFFQDGVQDGRRNLLMNSNYLMILMCIRRFLGARNT